jgi:hypothetical protein
MKIVTLLTMSREAPYKPPISIKMRLVDYSWMMKRTED